MIPLDPDRSHSHRRTDSTELEAGLCCSAPAGAGRTDAEDVYTERQWAGDSESLHRRRDKQPPTVPLCQHLHQTLLQTTPDRPLTLCRSPVYDTVVLESLPERIWCECVKFLGGNVLLLAAGIDSAVEAIECDSQGRGDRFRPGNDLGKSGAQQSGVGSGKEQCNT
jgi:hypothetical protein